MGLYNRPKPPVTLALGEPGENRRWLPAVDRYVDAIEPSIRQTVREACNGLRPFPVFLTGSAGAGKTCLALCLLDRCRGYYATAAGFCDELIRADRGQLTYSSGYPRTTVEVWREWNDAELAVLDELSARDKVSDFHYETVKRAIDDRHGKPFVAITNMPIERLGAVYDDRIASRLAGGTVIEMTGDRRII